MSRTSADPLERCVVRTDESSAKRIIHFGEDFLELKLPVGTRVIYPPPPIEPVKNVDAAIRDALNNPEGCEPLYTMLKPGMRVTIAVDDISLPLPMMRRPDIRERVLNIVLDTLADHGIEDIHIIIAICLHRRMTPSEIRRMVGKRVFDEFYPGRLYNHDAEDSRNMVHLGETKKKEQVVINRRAVESDLLIYVNLNFVPMDGGHKSVAVGLTNYDGLRKHHAPDAILKSMSYMDPEHSELHHSCNRQGKIVDKELNVFTIETTINNRMYGGELSFLNKNEDDFTKADQWAFKTMSWTLSKVPRPMKRSILMRVPSAFQVTGITAGRTEPVHKKTLDMNFRQYTVPVKGQADVVVSGMPYLCPYNVNSIMNPLLVHCTALGYFFNMFKGGTPLLKKGGVMIICHPLYDEFHPDHHPSYIEFFHRLLPETRDSKTLQSKYEESFAKDSSYVHMYRHGNAYHGAHPFYMWYWGENGRAHAGKVIVVGNENEHVPRILGWDTAPNIEDAISQARGFLGYEPDVTLMHHPPLFLTEVEA